MRPQIEGIVKDYLENAKKFLEKKQWTKARHLAKALDITSARAGQILSYLPEWRPWNEEQRNRSQRLWRRVSE